MDEKLHACKLYDLPASADFGNIADRGYYREIEIAENDAPDNKESCVRMPDESMETMLFNGDIVFVCEQPSVDDDKIGIFALNGDMYIKNSDIKYLYR